MKKAAVIGFPVKHSWSPIIHNYWIKEHGIFGEYEKIEVHPNDLKSCLLYTSPSPRDKRQSRMPSSA